MKNVLMIILFLVSSFLVYENYNIKNEYLDLHSNYESLYEDYDNWVPNSFSKTTTYQFAKTAHINSCVELKVNQYGKSYGKHMKECIKRADKFIKETQELVEGDL